MVITLFLNIKQKLSLKTKERRNFRIYNLTDPLQLYYYLKKNNLKKEKGARRNAFFVQKNKKKKGGINKKKLVENSRITLDFLEH